MHWLVADSPPIVISKKTDAALVSYGLTDILYQRDREFIAFVRPDLAVSGMGSSFAVRAADIRAMSAA